jgi:GNAT superfamily N-acetyltransferase
LEFNKACAAYANCQIDGDILVLADIFVEDQCVVRHPDFLWRLFGRKTLEVNFRKQRIGRQLLTTVVAYAKSKGFRRIEGRMVAKDLDPNPKLSQWYQNQGFSIDGSLVFMDLTTLHDDSQYMPG